MKNYKRILAIVFVLTLLAGLCACGAKASLTGAAFQTTKSYDMAAAADTAMEEPAMPEAEAIMEEAGFGMTGESAEVSEDAPAEDLASKIIYSANICLQTKEFDRTIAALEQSVAAIGGFIENSNVSGDVNYLSDGSTETVNRYAYYTVRIPCDQFKSFVSQSAALGNVTSLYKNADNVTSAYSDYEARLASLKTEQTRLLELLEKAESVDAIITIEDRLSDVRYEIDSIEQNLRNLDRRISYSSVSLNIDEVAVYTPTASVRRTFGERIGDAFRDGWSGFSRGVQDFAVWFIGALPVLLLLAVIAAAVIVIVRRSRKKSRARKESEQEQQK